MYHIVTRQKTYLSLEKETKYKQYKLLQYKKLCIGGHRSTLFISRTHTFQKLLENIADLIIQVTIYHC